MSVNHRATVVKERTQQMEWEREIGQNRRAVREKDVKGAKQRNLTMDGVI